MLQSFEILEHTADIGFRAWGGTVAELFENASLALITIAADTDAIEAREQREVEVSGEDYESLLVNWLSEVLYLFDADHFAAKSFRVSEIEPTRARGHLLGERRDPARHPWKLIVKAVTYHEIEVTERQGRWEARIFLDI
jgi:SHS2 domain-containing protein